MWVHQQLMTGGTGCIRGLLLAWFPLAEGNTNLSAIMLSLCVSLAHHYDDVIMGVIASLITSLMIVYSTVYSDTDQRKHQCSASLAFVWGIHRGPVNSPHKWPVTRKMFPFDDVIMMLTYNDSWLCANKLCHQWFDNIWGGGNCQIWDNYQILIWHPTDSISHW